MHQKSSPSRATRPPAGQAVSVARTSRKLLIRRLRELEKLSAKELAVIMADAEKIKAAFQLKR